MQQPCLVIMAAGMGSRFGGPKQTTPVDEYGHFLLHYSLFDAYRAGFRKVVFVVKEETAEEFRESVGPAVAAAFDVRYAYQKLDTLPEGYTVPDGRTKPWGTAHAVLCAAPEIDGPFAVINSDDYHGIEAYRLLYDFLAVPRPERSYALVGFRLRNTVTANGSVSRGVCTERGGMLESITERTHIEQRGADAAYTEDGEHFIDLPGDTTVSMNFWGFSPLYLRELAQRFPAFLDENLPRNPLKCEYFVPSIVDAQLHAGTADVTMLHTDDAWHGVTYHDDLPDVVAALRALRDAGKYPDNSGYISICACGVSHRRFAFQKSITVLKRGLRPDCSARAVRRRRTARTFAGRAVFSPPHMSPEKMIPLSFAAPLVKGYEVL